ncbi:MAG TPA: amidase [Gaiellaceae bacterium]|nr:amidase [Gaiellaceae bacterium]
MRSVWLARPERVDGVPVAIKDLLDTAGLTTTYGSAIFAEHVPVTSAQSVLRLEAAGYAVAGKTNLHEFAYGISSQNPHYGTVPNPRAPGRLAGGSSGGSAAAIAAGDVELALGTDSGGSIRIPSAWCGVVGLKPTFGLVPVEGCFPLAPSYDHVGPIASSVAGCVALLQALVPGFAPTTLDSLDDLAVGVAWLEHSDDDVRGQIEARLPPFPAIELPLVERHEYAFFKREVADVHRGLFPERADEYGENVRWKLERCVEVTDAEVTAAERVRAEYRERCDELLDRIDLLVTPTVPIAPPPDDVDERNIRDRATLFTYPFNVLGRPALAVPCGNASIQIVGRLGEDALVLAAGAVLASLV